MPKQTIPSGSTITVNAPTAVAIHGKRAYVRSFNPGAIDQTGQNTGIYDVMVEGQNFPSWLFPHEMDVVNRAATPSSDALRGEALNYVVSLLTEAKEDVRDTTVILAQQKERIKTLTKLVELLGD